VDKAQRHEHGMTRTILVVDDHRAVLDLLSAALQDEGYRVVRASDGVEALACMEREAPDLVVTDFRMPRMNGVELVARLRAYQTLPVPIILMSAVDPLPIALPHRTAVLPKPFTLDALLALMGDLLPTP
jgi:CheY-like chemotaxis protein